MGQPAGRWAAGPGEEDVAPERANLGRQRHGPAPIGSHPAGESALGCGQLLGDVWEWTSSDFRPYPGSRRSRTRNTPRSSSSRLQGPPGRLLGHASRGARNTFRNWDFPIRRQLFGGFRCARTRDQHDTSDRRPPDRRATRASWSKTSAQGLPAGQGAAAAWFYDEGGSEPRRDHGAARDYQTRRDRSILASGRPRSWARGCGDAGEPGPARIEKMCLLSEPPAKRGASSTCLVPFDVSERSMPGLGLGARRPTSPGLEAHSVVGEFDRHVDLIPGASDAQLSPSSAARSATLARAGAGVPGRPGRRAEPATTLLGVDLVKEEGAPGRGLRRRAGVTAHFNRNVFAA